MKKADLISLAVFIKGLGRRVFTTHELVRLSGKSASTVVQSLNRLARQGLLIKVYRGVWADPGTRPLSPLEIIPHLFSRPRVYVSFISALHLHGIVEQIPQVITLASLSHTRTVRTRVGIFSVHQIAPSFFDGMDWYRGEGSFLIATPEKALVDSLYLSGRRKKQFGHFPELHFGKEFDFRKARQWVGRIRGKAIRRYVSERLKKVIND